MAKRPKRPKAKPKVKPKARAKAVTAKRVVEADAAPIKDLPTVEVKAEHDDEAWGEDGLTPRMRLFVEALIGPAGGVATRAAEMAGYASDNNNALRATASRLLTTANIQRAIERAVAGRFGDAEDVRRSVAAIANGNAADYLEYGPDGKLGISLDKLAAAGMLGLLHEVKEEGFQAGQTVVIIKRKLKLYDKLRALELLGKLNGQFVERKDITSDGKAVVVKVLSGVSMDEI